MGDIEELDKITIEDLYAYYNKISKDENATYFLGDFNGKYPYNTIDYINRNTSSSAVARDINNRTNLQYALSANNLRGEKTNKETDMISANIQYQDAGRKEMGKEMSDYLNRVIDFRNDRLAGKVSALTQSMAGLASNVNSLADNVEQRSINRDNAYLTAATANQEVLEYLKSLNPNRFRRLFGMKNS